MLARLFAYLQYLLPKFWMTAIVYRLTRVRHVGIKDFLITRFIRLYDVETEDVELTIPTDFTTFNKFFIRELKDGARPIDASDHSIVSPVDGTVSQAGQLRGDAIFQAKGIEYSLGDLLATNLDDARAYTSGCFATIYLAPYNYHRVHAPLAGTLVSASYVPGDLFSVNAATAAYVSGLFRRNERLVLNFETTRGPAAIVLVGALNVGSITTPWSGEIRPRSKGVVETVDLGPTPVSVNKGDLLGWFNMGSTVILLLPDGRCQWNGSLVAGATVRMGAPIGTSSDANNLR
ncbi:MAG: archaetidylserine decarboxylase [Woeseiaceae bacterium]